MKISYPLSFAIVFWVLVGIARYFFDNKIEKKKNLSAKIFKQELKKVAVCVPAHNEEDVIEEAILSIKNQISPKQIFVVSDGSTDKTPDIARRAGCRVLVNLKGEGKAKALRSLLEIFNIYKNYDYVIFVDADTRLHPQYFSRALKYMYFNPEVAALAAHANPYWREKTQFNIPDFISAYRTRLYKVLQMSLMYGMTWKYANVNPVIPGFAALYRTKILKKLNLYTKGVWIEDFNLAFQIHKKNLGTIAYRPEISASYKDPNSIEDYWEQVRRWNIGFFQTVKKNGVWPSFFWLFLILFTFELILFSIFVLTVPILLFILLLSQFGFVPMEQNLVAKFIFPQGYTLAIETLLGVLIFDYAITVIVALKDKKYRLILYGLFFSIFQILNSLILLSSFKKGFFEMSGGTWAHAKRI